MLLDMNHLTFWSDDRPVSRMARLGLGSGARHQVLGSRGYLLILAAGVGDRNQFEYPIHWWKIRGVSQQNVVDLTHGPVEVQIDGGAGLVGEGEVEEQVVGPEQSDRNNI